MQLIFEYPEAWLAVCAVVAFLLTFLLYYKSEQNSDQSIYITFFLSFLRFAALFLLGVLLLNPLLKNVQTERIEPLILVLEDQSSSVKNFWPQSDQKVYQENRKTLFNSLQEKFNTRFYGFGQELKSISPDTAATFVEKETNISKAIEQVLSAHPAANIGAIVLISDGLYNQGVNPLYVKTVQNIPLYTIATGDSSIKKDAQIRQLRFNKLVYLGDKFEVRAEINAQLLKGKSAFFSVKNENGSIVYSQTLTYNSDFSNNTLSFYLEAAQPGIHAYTAQLQTVSGEINKTNNLYRFYVEVVDGRQQICIAYDAPHPDIKAIRQALESNKNFDISVLNVSQIKETDISKYQLWILHGLPSKNNASSTIVRNIANQAQSVWFITAGNTDIKQLNSLQTLIQITQQNQSFNDVKARQENNFSRFILPVDAVQYLSEMPPLMVPFGQYQLQESAEVCWWQNIGSVATRYPLLVMGQVNQKKRAVLMGEGIWRWRMQEYQMKAQQTLTDEWIQRIVQYNSVKNQQQTFQLKSAKNIYPEQEAIWLDAILYNESYQAINNPEISVLITGANGFSQRYTMDRNANAYALKVGLLPPGAYKAQAEVVLNGQKIISSAQWVVQEILLENEKNQADYALMRNLAIQQGAKMYDYKQMQSLVNALDADDRIQTLLKEIESTRSLLNWKWICFLILGLLFIEWFVRRLSGKY